MKAQEVLRRYAAGERNFRNADLRGANFKEQDLSGADFSGADIRGTSFQNATLRGVNFTQVTAGLRKRWLVLQLVVVFASSTVIGFFHAFAGVNVSLSFSVETGYTFFLSLFHILLLIAVYGLISVQGFTLRASGSVLTSYLFTVTSVGISLIAVIFAFAFSGIDLFGDVSTFAITAIFAFVSIFFGAFVFAFAIANESRLAILLVFLGVLFGTFIHRSEIMGALLDTTLGLVFDGYIGWEVYKENNKLFIVRLIGLSAAALGGTSFAGADLTNTTFYQSRLKNINFADSKKRTILTWVSWKQVKQLNWSRLGSSILQDRRVRVVLTNPEKGYKQNLSGANLRGANLSGITLEKANLKRAILSDALLTNAALKDANLTEAQAVNTDFTGACLTGATLEAWNIDNTTILKNIDCQYVFLTEQPNALGVRERLPHNSDKIFQPGDFEKFFKEFLDEVQILIRDGIEPVAFRAAFEEIMQENSDITQDAIKSIEKQGSDLR